MLLHHIIQGHLGDGEGADGRLGPSPSHIRIDAAGIGTALGNRQHGRAGSLADRDGLQLARDAIRRAPGLKPPLAFRIGPERQHARALHQEAQCMEPIVGADIEHDARRPRAPEEPQEQRIDLEVVTVKSDGAQPGVWKVTGERQEQAPAPEVQRPGPRDAPARLAAEIEEAKTRRRGYTTMHEVDEPEARSGLDQCANQFLETGYGGAELGDAATRRSRVVGGERAAIIPAHLSAVLATTRNDGTSPGLAMLVIPAGRIR
jgi:hypothetical protein